MIIAFIAGIISGTFFFGGLWLTIKIAVPSKMPALLMMLSFMLRTAITILAFYSVSSGNWRKLLIALLGFVVARFIIGRFTKSGKKMQLKEV